MILIPRLSVWSGMALVLGVLAFVQVGLGDVEAGYWDGLVSCGLWYFEVKGRGK